MVCKDVVKANKMTFVKYAVAAQVHEAPLAGKEARINPYKDPAMRALLPSEMLAEIQGAIDEVADLKGKYVELARAAKVYLSIA